MFAQLRSWQRYSLSYRARGYTLHTFVWSSALFHAKWRRMRATLETLMTAATVYFLWKGRAKKGANTLSSPRVFSVGSRDDLQVGLSAVPLGRCLGQGTRSAISRSD